MWHGCLKQKCNKMASEYYTALDRKVYYSLLQNQYWIGEQKISKTNLKINRKNTTNLPRYLQIWIIIIILLVKVYLEYLSVKNESALLVLQVITPLNGRNFSEFFLSL